MQLVFAAKPSLFLPGRRPQPICAWLCTGGASEGLWVAVIVAYIAHTYQKWEEGDLEMSAAKT